MKFITIDLKLNKILVNFKQPNFEGKSEKNTLWRSKIELQLKLYL